MRSLSNAVRFCVALAVGLGLGAPAHAMPAGYFHLRGTVKDNYGGQALRSMDVTNAQGQVTGLVRLNTTGYAKDALLWKERLPRNGTIDVIRLENKLTGQCLAFPDESIDVVLRPCNSPKTLWQKISMGGNKWVFRRSQNVTGAFLDDFVDCLAKDARFPGRLVIMPCNDGFTPEMVWEAYVSG